MRRDLQVLTSAKACIMSDRRRLAPYGLDGGANGQPGHNVLIRSEAERTLPGKVCFDLESGDVLSVRTPGGGAYGHHTHVIATDVHGRGESRQCAHSIELRQAFTHC